MSAVRPGDWSTGLFDCFAEPGGFNRTCYGCWCPCCLAGDNFQRLPRHVLCGGSWCGGCMCWYMSAIIAAACIPMMATRAFLRHKYNIEGSAANDFFTTWCCPQCALCQEAREMDLREGEGRPVGEGPSGGLPLTEPPVAMYPQGPPPDAQMQPMPYQGMQPPPPGMALTEPPMVR